MIRFKHRSKIYLSPAAGWLSLIGWAGLAGLVILTDPEVFADYYYLPIWPAMLLALAASLRLILGSRRRGLIFGLAGTIYMGFRYLGIGGWIYGVLLLGLAGTVEWYLIQKTQNTQRARKIRGSEVQRTRFSGFLTF